MEIFSERLREARIKRNFTQKDISEAVGISQQYYNRFEKNKGEPNLETLFLIAKLLRVTSDYLIGLTDYADVKTAEDAISKRVSALEKTVRDVLLRDGELTRSIYLKNLEDVNQDNSDRIK